MIEILGNNEGSEFEAAVRLRDMLLESWAWVENDQSSNVKIIAGVQCHGQSPRDLDIVLLGSFSQRARFSPFVDFYDRAGKKQRPDKVQVKDLCLVIEVKTHDASGVKWTGTQLSVRYDQKWSDVTHQSEAQKYSLKNYLSQSHSATPYIVNLIWLQNVKNSDLPARPHNVLGGNSSWELFLNVVMQLIAPAVYGGECTIGSGASQQSPIPQTIAHLTKRIEPTTLDREKMDRICRSAVKVEWLEVIGKKQVTFVGRGGAGKTVILLRLAWQIYEESHGRVLLLTYNKALISDLRRLFTLMNLSDDIGSKTIQIQTVHSFFRQVLIGLKILSADDDFFANYDQRIEEAVEFLKAGALTSEDIEGLFAEKPILRWDYVFLDEAQDWFEGERDLIRWLFPPSKLVVADGGDQLVRRTSACNWQEGVASDERKVFTLKKCLRMKAGLARFVTAFSREFGVAWESQPNMDAPGGRVLIIEGDYFQEPGWHQEIVNANATAGNYPVDMLMCVPPGLVEKTFANTTNSSIPAQILAERGSEVWDGVDLETRSGYPTSVNQLRIVQYDSCRGLEGWTVINLGLDEFYQHKLNLWQPSDSGSDELSDDANQAHRFAARWIMIPLTRAIDTLVIQIGPGKTPLRTALEKAVEYCPDSVIWKTI